MNYNMAKDEATYRKVADTFKQKADRLWSKGNADIQRGNEGKGYSELRMASKSYETAKTATEAADRLKSK